MALSSEVGSYADYAYTGGMQTQTVARAGIYKLEAWGAGGAGGSAGRGGYSAGYKYFNRGDVIHICVGGCHANGAAGGYNGGGLGYIGQDADATLAGGGGGGATSIASISGTIAAIGKKEPIYLIAGGGGGGGNADISDYVAYGGAGGGLTGGNGHDPMNASVGMGGTQTTGAAFGKGGDYWIEGKYAPYIRCGGGGGGLYGGGGGHTYNHNAESRGSRGGGGGSGYIGGVPEMTYKGTTYSPATTQGGGKAANQSGAARITFIFPGTIPVFYDGVQLEAIVFNGTEIGSLIFNGTKIYMRKAKEAIGCILKSMACGFAAKVRSSRATS